MSYKKQELFTLREHVSSPPVFGGVHVAHRFIFCYPIVRLYVPSYVYCDYDFRINTMFSSYLPPVVSRRSHVLFTLFVLVAYSGVQHTLTI